MRRRRRRVLRNFDVLPIAVIVMMFVVPGLVPLPRGAQQPGTAPTQLWPREQARRIVFDGPTTAIVDNGTIQLGVNAQGHLNVSGGSPSSGQGTTFVGLRYVPTNAEATAPGCLCEGWGAADATSGVSGYANVSTDGVVNLEVVDFATTPASARSVVDVGSTLRVTHNYQPSSVPNLYKVTVSLQNTSASTVDARYRRVMDWDVEPTAFNEFVTAHTGASPLLAYNSNDGFATANPLGSRTSGILDPPLVTGDFTDAGPADHGALFDFSFGRLDPGQTKTFRIFYGAAPTEADALAALGAVGAKVWSLGQASTTEGPSAGTPN